MSSGAAIPAFAPSVGDLGTQKVPGLANELTCATTREEEDLVLSSPPARAADSGSETPGRRRPRLAAPLFLTSADESLISPHSLGESDRRRTRSLTRRHDGPHRKSTTGDFVAAIGVGPGHQATLPGMGSGDDSSNDVHDGDVLWDPTLFSLQSSAAQELALSLIGRERRLAGRMLMMECLTTNQYDADAAQADFDRRTASRFADTRPRNNVTANDLTNKIPTHGPGGIWSGGPPFPWSDAEVAIFESEIEREGLHVSAIAQAVGRPKVEVLANYYWWRGRRGKVSELNCNDNSDHSLTSSQRPDDDDPDECCICQLRGFLIICDRCRDAFHLDCLDPPLERQDIPEGDWYCHECAVRLPAPLELLDAAVPQMPGDARSDAATRRRLLATQKELAGRACGVQSTQTSNNAHTRGGKGKRGHFTSQRENFYVGEGIRSHGRSPQAPAVSAGNDSDDSPSSSSEDESVVVESDNNHSPSSSVSSSPEKTVLEKEKRGRGSDSDESYRVSESDCGSDSDDDVGTVRNADRAAIRPTAVSGERARARSTEYSVSVPFRSDGSLGLKLSWNRKKKRLIVVSGTSQDEGTTTLNGTGRLFRGVNDVVLKVDGEDTNMRDFEEVMGMCRRRAEGQQFKQFSMLHEHDLEGESPPSLLSDPITTYASVTTGQTRDASIPVPTDANARQVAVSCQARNPGSAFHSVESNGFRSKTTEGLEPPTSQLAVLAQTRGPSTATSACESLPPKSSEEQFEIIDLTSSPPASPNPGQAGDAVSFRSSVSSKTRKNDVEQCEVIDLTNDSPPASPVRRGPNS
jgi:PHD-finger